MRFSSLPFRMIKNERGDALIFAMMMVAICLISSLLMMSYSINIESGSKRPRIKSMMSSVEAKVRAALLTPGNYQGCVSSDVAASRGGACTLKTAAITGLSVKIPDIKCASGVPSCGISVTIETPFTMQTLASGQVVTRGQARINYEGVDFPMRYIEVDMDIPADILQSTGMNRCPTSKPKFNGFLPDGRMNCIALDPKLLANEFVFSVDPNGLGTTKGVLPSTDFSCQPDQYFDRVRWVDGGNSIDAHCASRTDPFAAFGFNPKLKTSGGDVIYTPVP